VGRLERRAARREELLEAADRVIRRDGPDTSMAEIASEAGITKPILYKHFGDKGGLYQAVAERYVLMLMAELRRSLAGQLDPRSRIRTTIDTYVSFIDKDREAYRFLMHRAVGERPEAQATVADFIRQLGREIAVVLGEELRGLGVDSGGAEPWANGIVGMVHLACDRWLEEPTMSRDALVDYLTTLLWSGFSQIALGTQETDVGVSG
jgi:AcrR family transcriptional regulator